MTIDEFNKIAAVLARVDRQVRLYEQALPEKRAHSLRELIQKAESVVSAHARAKT